ncbi:MAG: hypothetical protein MK085_01475 [Phycisphaerales bacterium]|nr:hypothetical protein [Phycisphaerales bacterium]
MKRATAMPRSRIIHLLIMSLLGHAVIVGQAPAQDTPAPSKADQPTEPQEEEVQEAAEEAAEEEEAAPPSLDDLLGIEETEDTDETDAIADAERQRNLERALGEEKPADAFKAAVSDMQESAGLLRKNQSTGLGTQRLQARIVERLQILIDSAKKQQQQQQQSSSSSSSSSSQQNPGRQQGEQSQQNQGQQQNPSPSDSTEAGTPPNPEHAVLEGELEETGMEWGNLPPRIRERINQGMRDRVSELYRSLTEAYYRRMAEEASR